MKKILIIEDSKQSSLILKEVLEKQGYVVVTTNDGVEGIRMAKRELPDLILLDLLLPKISGFDIATKLAQDDKTRNIPIIVISTIALERQTLEKLKKIDVLKFMKKPYNIDELIEEVKRTINNE